MAKTSELFEHTQRYVREVMADRLRAEGFVSYKGEDIHWYKRINDDVVHAVYFVTRHSSLNAMLEIKYGCHPLFIPPIFQKSPYLCAEPGYEQMYNGIPEIIPNSTPYGMMGSQIRGITNRVYRFPDVLILCPQDDKKGLDILEQVLGHMDGIKTPIDCYHAHKKWRSSQIENDAWLTMSTYFVDEVLYWKDEALYPYCQMYVNSMAKWLEGLKRDGKLSRKDDQRELARLIALRDVFEGGDLQAYLQTFQSRAQETLHLLEKNTGTHAKVAEK